MNITTADLLDRLQKAAELAMQFGLVNRSTEHPNGEPESDTTHTVMLGLAVLEVAPFVPGINVGRALGFTLVHDLPEADPACLDTCTAWGLNAEQKAAKRAREAAATERLRARLGNGSEVMRMLDEYERQECLESRIVNYLDKIMPKLTHRANLGAALRRLGMTHADMVSKHEDQGSSLAAKYPEQHVVRCLFAAAADACERELLGAEAGDP